MNDDRSFTAGEAGLIAGVNAITQQDWRRRGILPPGDGKWTRYGVRDLCRLRLTRALLEFGLPIGLATQHLADDFLDMMHSALVGAERPEAYAQQLALIVRQGGEFHRAGIFGLRDLAPMVGNGIAPDFTSCLIVNLSALGAEMLENIRLLQRSDALDRETEGKY